MPEERVPYRYARPDAGEMDRRATEFRAEMERRRSVRAFSPDPVPARLIELAIETASTAPSGAHQQPWTFVAVSDPDTKHRIRVAAEAEERRSYESRMSQEWLDALAPLGTDEHKPFLEAAPYLIAVFAQRYGALPDGRQVRHYYVNESVGIATGLLITALHHAGLVSLTYTPSPMDFLNRLLHRPSNEKAFMILVTGYPKADVTVPVISKKPLEEIATFI